jgi:hypothetical protein
METPMAEKNNDPVAVWRKMFDDMERAFGAFALRAMTPPQLARPPVDTGRREEGGVETRAGAEIGDVAERLDSIDAQLHEIKALLQEMRPKAAKSRPPRPKSAPLEQK